MKNSIFSTVEAKTNVKKEDILKLANSIQNEDLTKEENLRSLIHAVATMAQKEVSKEKEDRLVAAIKSNKSLKDLDKLL